MKRRWSRKNMLRNKKKRRMRMRRWRKARIGERVKEDRLVAAG